jgi:hypothetical protein
MKIVVCGSRSWSDYGAIHARLAQLAAGSVVISGGAPGADRLAERAARSLGLQLVVMPADWRRHGRAAGPIRNAAMLAAGPELVLAFWDGVSRGTADMVQRSRAAGVSVEVHAPSITQGLF